MLAQNFKTDVELGISERLWRALTIELGMLERGEIRADQFNMQKWRTECGTVCCLGGWAEQIANVEEGTFKIGNRDTCISDDFRGIDELFAPFGWTKMQATPDQAATALRSYLTTGNAHWDKALNENPTVGEKS